MKDNTWAVLFIAILFIVMVIAIIRPMLSPTGKATGFIEELCTSNSDCSYGEVCCYFSGQDSGVCDMQESCDSVRESTDTQKLSQYQQPSRISPGWYYAILITLLAAVVILIFIFYKKAR